MRILYAVQNNPLLGLSVALGGVLLWKNYKKVLFTSGRLLWLILCFFVHLVQAAALVVTVVASAVGAGSSNKLMHLNAVISEMINIRWLPQIYDIILRYGLYVIPHFLFTLRRPFTFGEKVIPDTVIYIGSVMGEPVSPFEMPAPVLLQ